MKPIIQFRSINDINKFGSNKSVKHPLITIVDFSKIDQSIEEGTQITMDFYCIMFKNYCTNHIRYGQQKCDFQEGSLLCIAPKQVIVMDSQIEKKENMTGWGLLFHPDLIRGTSLGAKMKDYTFFSYETSEALHLSDKEKQILYDCILKIQSELDENIDTHTQNLIVSNIELLLNYCSRYYGRQFITRKNSNKDILTQVETHLQNYFCAGSIKEKGLPTVKYLAESVHLSPNYLSDLLKKETGMNAQDHIHFFLIEEAKNILMNSDSTVSEIAYKLCFEYPQYFSRIFKSKTGMSPLEFRNKN
ncbi:AraC family transcriptional regulator [Ancylomarina salipaludis]|uniref:AraC family transcriptional regulator n=1 Tax=Ancylomarina salipaludis TaxID=2501299 RepID=A0A4Q1JN37_9BACT|nr:helix-turn-helix transcriptional regulator [Ancylomarina salipaludis]RXQ95864.1 AraC family transcriptional regulator [Ancylomarina salipaludis]